MAPPTMTETATTTSYHPTQAAQNDEVSNRSNGAVKASAFTGASRFGRGPWVFNDVLIPANAGTGLAKKYKQRRTLLQYLILSIVGLWAFYSSESVNLRAAGLGLVFPGAGFLAIGTTSAYYTFATILTLFPLTIVAWFGMGGVFFPLALYFGSAVAGGLCVGDTLPPRAGLYLASGAYGTIALVMLNAASGHTSGQAKAKLRNKYLVDAVVEQHAQALAVSPAGSRELDLKTLRFVQHMIERGLSKHDDYSYHDVLDQFQTSALRYQLAGVACVLSQYQTHYAPSFHGYVSQASRNVITKSLSKKVMNYWKWESIFGKFRFSDWNPFEQDNIMSTGYLSAAAGLYEKATGDRRFHAKDGMEFVVTNEKRYKTDYPGLADALNRNMTDNTFCLYPCEPNWTYPICNLVGMSGLIIADETLGRNDVQRLRPKFEKALEEEFTQADGRIVPLRSELTGFTPPGLWGSLTDCIHAMLLTAFLPHIAHRNWAIIRKEFVSFDANGTLEVNHIKAADMMDPGNYRYGGQGPIRAYIAGAAAEFGDEKVRIQALEQLDKYFPVNSTPLGGLYNKGLSSSSQVVALMGRMLGFQDLVRGTLDGPSANCLRGPLLAEAPFPAILVAKAYSHDAQGLELVLYNGEESGTFELKFERLSPGQKYALGDGQTMVADQKGCAKAQVTIDGRTHINISRA